MSLPLYIRNILLNASPIAGRILVLMCVLTTALTSVQATANSPDPYAHVFKRALNSARDGNWKELDKLEKQLPKDYVLNDYLEYYRLRANFDSTPVESVLAWLRRNDTSPLNDALRSRAMHYYGKRSNWSALRAVSQGVPGETALRCYYFESLLNDDPEHAIEGARELWLSGQSRPDTCDRLFSAVQKRGALNDDLIWQRMLLAFHNNNEGLMRYLRGQLQDSKTASRAEVLLQLYRQPNDTRVLMPKKQSKAVAMAGLFRLADKDPVYARKLMPVMMTRYQLNDAESETINGRIAWFSIIRDIPENRAWVDTYLATSDNLRLLEQRTRRAVMDENWPSVLTWINKLPSGERNSAHWRYWRARALDETNQGDTQPIMQLAANERSFWGFLAAQTLGLPYALNEQAPPQTTVELGYLQHQGIARIETLSAISENELARDEWLFLMRKSESDQLIPLANAALSRSWYHFSVETALFSGKRNVLDWRFPAAMRSQFEALGDKVDLDPWLLMALSRRESAFNPHARSHVGASGLMQLMPATASAVAKQIGESQPSKDDLFRPEINLRLGGNYLAGLLKRYDGNRVLALAAYNAGPHRVDRWLDDKKVPFDVFIESIPFYETREYVQAVLAYRVILSRHADDKNLLGLLRPEEKAPLYGPPMLALSQQ